MVELLIFLALLGWGIVSFLEYLSSLAAFPTLLTAALAVPLLSVVFYERLLRIHRLEFLQTKRPFLPPERFYWPNQAKMLSREIGLLSVVVMVVWPLAIWFPAAWDVSATSISGWVSGLIGIVALAGACSRGWLFLVASQRFDRLTPRVIGSVRRFMFWLSDNHEFLGEEPELPKKPRKESVY